MYLSRLDFSDFLTSSCLSHLSFVFPLHRRICQQYYRQTICLTNRQDHSRFDNVRGFPEKTEKPGIAVTAVLVYVPGCTVLSELLCVVEADPAVTFAGIGFQQTPLGCALARCLRNNGEHTPASETTGAVVRTGAFADTKTVGGHPNRVRLEGSADGI